MNPKPGLPATLESEVLAKAAENMSVRQISAWLETAHATKVSAATISRFLAKRRTERADVAKTVVREQLGKTLNADLDRLEQIRAELQAQAQDPEISLGGYVKLVELEVKVIDRKLHYSGAGEPDTDPNGPTKVQIFLPPEDE